MKKRGQTSAFTMLEIIFVIVVIGIISAVAFPRMSDNNLRLAADQVLGHIRYTQHLAMQDDKFDPVNPLWIRTRWQIIFGKSAFTQQEVAYTIFSDRAGGGTGQPDVVEMARNPQDPTKVLSGGYSGTLQSADPRATSELNVGKKYGIKAYLLDGGCAGARLSFDYLGRPIGGNQSTMTGAYTAGTQRLITETCYINLCLTDPCPVGVDPKHKVTIAIEPETGYARIHSN